MKNIRAKAVCIFRNQDKVLLAQGFDPAKNEKYLSPIGGGIDFGEQSADAAIREVKEELGTEAHELQLLGVIENLFIFDDKEGHEIVFIYEGKFKDNSFYQKNMISGVESNGYTFEARWYDVNSLNSSGVPVYPNSIVNLL
ncbi:NUDIX hydrolase [Pseudomonas sp. SJZ079]|uniref:NUDIX hydrolase n=1 Tax=Pseudomonas sp. SJZ079 TaxID=2572887 RepID=UPI0011BD5E1C|nr:NUDIX hydrolase [Pseudomonas sp. SJZ079]